MVLSHTTLRPMPETLDLIRTLMQTRQTILPKRLDAPGPDSAQLQQILAVAAHAPDHRQLLPWRFVLIPEGARAALAESFAQALIERDAQALPGELDKAREKAYRAPVLLLLVVHDKVGDADIGLDERVLSAGCAVQNMLLMATALGFGSALTSGRALKSRSLRQLFALGSDEHAVCFLSMGTVARSEAGRARPSAAQYFSTLPAQTP